MNGKISKLRRLEIKCNRNRASKPVLANKMKMMVMTVTATVSTCAISCHKKNISCHTLNAIKSKHRKQFTANTICFPLKFKDKDRTLECFSARKRFHVASSRWMDWVYHHLFDAKQRKNAHRETTNSVLCEIDANWTVRMSVILNNMTPVTVL